MSIAWEQAQPPTVRGGLSWHATPLSERADVLAFTRAVYLRRAIMAVTDEWLREMLVRHNTPEGYSPCHCCRGMFDAIKAEYRRIAT